MRIDRDEGAGDLRDLAEGERSPRLALAAASLFDADAWIGSTITTSPGLTTSAALRG